MAPGWRNKHVPSPVAKAESDWRAALDRLAGAYSENTLRGYRADFTAFEDWCGCSGRVALPASIEGLVAFVEFEAARSAPATLKRRLAAIRKIHRIFRFPDPVSDEEVAIALRRAKRHKPCRPKQAAPVNDALRQILIGACPLTLKGLRDRAMIAVGYDSLCRRSELVSLEIEDLEILAEGGARAIVRRAKTDPFGDGRWIYMTETALAHLQCWLDAAGIAAGAVFRPVVGNRVLSRPLDPVAVNRTLKGAARRAKVSSELIMRLSGHSMRVGAAQDLMRQGRGLLQIMTAGGWKSVNIVGRYVGDAPFNIWSLPPTPGVGACGPVADASR